MKTQPIKQAVRYLQSIADTNLTTKQIIAECEKIHQAVDALEKEQQQIKSEAFKLANSI